MIAVSFERGFETTFPQPGFGFHLWGCKRGGFATQLKQQLLLKTIALASNKKQEHARERARRGLSVRRHSNKSPCLEIKTHTVQTSSASGTFHVLASFFFVRVVLRRSHHSTNLFS